MRLLLYRQAAIDGSGIVAQKDADRVFLNGDLAAQVGQVRLGCVEEFLRLAHVGKRPGSVLLKSLCELERFLACLDGVLGDDHLCIEAAEFEVSFGDALDQGGAGRSLTPLAGQKISPCGFALTAIETPEIEIPCSGRAGTSAVKEGARECAVVPGASERRRD